MSNTATLLTVLQRAAVLADMNDFAASTFVTKTAATQWVNDELSKIHYLLADCGGDYFKSSTDITLIGGTAAYALPATFYKALGVDYVDQSGNRFRMGRFGWQERDKYQEQGGIYTGLGWSEYEYNVMGTNVEFVPTPGTGTARLYYVSAFAKLAADGDPVDPSVPEGWEEHAALGVAIKALIKEETDPSAIMALRSDLWANMKNSVRPRDQGEPKRIVDVYGRFNRGARLLRRG